MILSGDEVVMWRRLIRGMLSQYMSRRTSARSFYSMALIKMQQVVD